VRRRFAGPFDPRGSRNVTRSWRLTKQAEESLTEIARWTLATFGPRQADIYEDELIARCQAIADGRAMTQSCAVLTDTISSGHLRFARAGEHFVVFLEQEERVVVLDFLHGRSNLSPRLAALADPAEGNES